MILNQRTRKYFIRIYVTHWFCCICVEHGHGMYQTHTQKQKKKKLILHLLILWNHRSRSFGALHKHIESIHFHLVLTRHYHIPIKNFWMAKKSIIYLLAHTIQQQIKYFVKNCFLLCIFQLLFCDILFGFSVKNVFGMSYQCWNSIHFIDIMESILHNIK